MTTTVLFTRLEPDPNDTSVRIERESVLTLHRDLDSFCDSFGTGTGAIARLTFYTSKNEPILLGIENYSDHAAWKLGLPPKNGDEPIDYEVMEGDGSGDLKLAVNGRKEPKDHGVIYSEGRSIHIKTASGACEIRWSPNGKER